MQAISSYRVDRPTNKHTNTHTQTNRQDRLQYTVPLSLARSVKIENYLSSYPVIHLTDKQTKA